MDADLKHPPKTDTEEPPKEIASPASALINAKPVVATEAQTDQAEVIRRLVSEALIDDVELNRLRELNKLIAALIAAQQAGSAKAPGPSAETLITMRRTLRQTVLDSYKEEYKEYSDVWKSVETKAQGTVTIAGIFIAASFTFAKDLAATRLDWYGKLFLGAAIIFLIPSIVLSVLALRRRTIKSIPAGVQVEGWADDIQHSSDEELAELTRRFVDQHSLVWNATVESTKEAAAEKEKLLYAAQILLLFAIGAATVVTLKLVNI